MTARVDHDKLFKEVIEARFVDFLELFRPAALRDRTIESFTFPKKELLGAPPRALRRYPDVFAEVRFVGDEGVDLIHVEIQSYPEAEFAERMFLYSAWLYEAKRRPVHPMALFTYDTVNRTEPDTFGFPLPGFETLRFTFMPVQLRQLPWREYVNRPNALAVALAAKMGYARDERPRVKAECIRRLVLMKLDEAEEHLLLEFVGTYLRLDEREELEYNSFVGRLPEMEKQAIMDRMIDWERQGQRQLLVRLIGKRFGPMPAEDLARLKKLDSDALGELGIAVLTVSTYAAWQQQLFDLLQQQESEPGRG